MPATNPLPLAIGGMLALASAMGIGRFVYTPILPPMAEALSLSKAAAGLIASANFLGYLAGALLAAAPGLPGGRRRWFIGATAIGALSTAAMALASVMPVFLLLRFIGGVASAFVLVFGSALVLQRLAASGRPALSAVHFAGIGIGIALSALLVDALSAAGATWRALWLGAGAAAALAVPFVARLVPENPAEEGVQNDEPLPPGFWVLIVSYGLFGFGYVVTATFIVAAVRAAPDGHALELGIWLLVGLTAAPSTLFWNWVAKRQGAVAAYRLACLTQAMGIAAGGWATHTVLALVAAVLLGGTVVGLTAMGFALARAWAPGAQRRTFAAMTAGFGVGQIAGPVIAGALLDRTGSFVIPSLIAAGALVAAAAIATRIKP